jgi:hypothetical protein
MRQAVLCILGVLFVLCGTVYAKVELEEGVNQLQNGDFEQGTPAPWTMEVTGTGTGIIELDDKEVHSEESSLKVTTTAIDGENWHVKVVQTNLSFEANEKHTVKFWAKAEAPRVVQLCLQRNRDPWDGWLWLDFNITKNWQEFVHEITLPEDNDKGHFIAFHSGQSLDVWWLDDVRYYRGGADDEVVAEPVVQSVNLMDKLTSTWGGIKGNYR